MNFSGFCQRSFWYPVTLTEIANYKNNAKLITEIYVAMCSENKS